ncbi:Uncharacterised protein [uncultured Eubacterium sp.]|nr:Uncharacterised protein [uncultured Eubacterium sp.]
MEERVTKIYNACWKNYKEYLANHDMDAYNKRSLELCRQYGAKSDIKNLLFWFSPIVNKIHDEYLGRTN